MKLKILSPDSWIIRGGGERFEKTVKDYLKV